MFFSAAQSLNGVFYYMITTMLYPTLFGVVDAFPREFPIIVREHHAGMYTVAMYYIARVISYLPVYPVDGKSTFKDVFNALF